MPVATEGFTPGDELHGFTVQRVTPVPDLRLTAVELEHGATRAQHLHIARDDSENVFAVLLRTLPTDSESFTSPPPTTTTTPCMVAATATTVTTPQYATAFAHIVPYALIAPNCCGCCSSCSQPTRVIFASSQVGVLLIFWSTPRCVARASSLAGTPSLRCCAFVLLLLSTVYIVSVCDCSRRQFCSAST